jgi:gas vesicle protein
MKNLNSLVAFLGGAAIGAALGILFAPDKGEETRDKIKEMLEKKGIKLNKEEMKSFVNDIISKVKGKKTEEPIEEGEDEPAESRAE